MSPASSFLGLKIAEPEEQILTKGEGAFWRPKDSFKWQDKDPSLHFQRGVYCKWQLSDLKLIFSNTFISVADFADSFYFVTA